jgi:hypothetical protein
MPSTVRPLEFQNQYNPLINNRFMEGLEPRLQSAFSS